MGMAASQARFLTLTARKTNVEYEGQQVNQQRTSLANESAGLFNKMMALKVPTPPSANSFYNTRYTFYPPSGTYTIYDAPKPNGVGGYDITITRMVTRPYAKAESGVTGNLTKVGDEYTKFAPNGTDIDLEKIIKHTDGKFYFSTDSTFSTPIADMDYVIDSSKNVTDNTFYAYKDSENKYHYVAKSNLDAYYNSTASAKTLQTYVKDTRDLKENVKGVAVFTSGETGRFETMTITELSTDDQALKDEVINQPFKLDLTQVQDDEGYDKAMKEYEWQKMLYEKSINDINAQTESIQQQDRTLELRLKQLDTEQNALKTELEAVQKVIENNVESTFKTFA